MTPKCSTSICDALDKLVPRLSIFRVKMYAFLVSSKTFLKTTKHYWTKSILSRGRRRKLFNSSLMNKLIRRAPKLMNFTLFEKCPKLPWQALNVRTPIPKSDLATLKVSKYNILVKKNRAKTEKTMNRYIAKTLRIAVQVRTTPASVLTCFNVSRSLLPIPGGALARGRLISN